MRVCMCVCVCLNECDLAYEVWLRMNRENTRTSSKSVELNARGESVQS